MSEPESAFVADPVAEESKGDDSTFDAVEKMGRGAAKVRLGRKIDMRSSVYQKLLIALVLHVCVHN